MAYLSKVRKTDLRYIAFELGEDVPETSRIADLRNLILKSKNYDEELVQGMIFNLNAEAERHENEAKRQHELAMKKLEMESKTMTVNDSSSKPKLDWQTQLRHFDSKNDDIGLFLVHFERVMKRVKMESSLWTACLTGVLPSEIVELIMRESEELAENYSHVKELLLKRYKLSAEKFRQLFYSHKIKTGSTWREYYYELETYFNGWINGLKIETLEDLKGLIIANRIKQSAPAAIQEYYVSEWSSFKSPNILVDKIDEYVELSDLYKKNDEFVSPCEQNSVKRGEHAATKYRRLDSNICYNCFEKGHFARDCLKPKRPKFCTSCRTEGHGTKDCPKTSTNPQVNISSLPRVDEHSTTKSVTINGIFTEALMDTAADISMIKYAFAKQINVLNSFNNDGTTIRGIGGLIKSLGSCIANVMIDNIILKDMKLYIVSDDSFSGPNIIIGKDMIDIPDLVMVRKKGKSTLLHINEFQNFGDLEIEEEPKCAVLRISEPVTIEPLTIQMVEVSSNVENGNVVMLLR